MFSLLRSLWEEYKTEARTQREPCERQADRADNATGCFVTNVLRKLNPSVINYEMEETKEVVVFVIPYVVYSERRFTNKQLTIEKYGTLSKIPCPKYIILQFT